MDEQELTPGEKFVEYALQIGAITFTEFRLRSGRISPYMYNSGAFYNAERLIFLAKAYARLIIRHGLRPQVIFGPAYKGIALAIAIALQLGGKIGFAFNRKEEKTHGEGGFHVGAPLELKNVAVVDDVITTGESAEKAIAFIRCQNGLPFVLVIAFDRQERGTGNESATQQFARQNGIPVYAIATLDDLISVLTRWSTDGRHDHSTYAAALESVRTYRELYGLKS